MYLRKETIDLRDFFKSWLIPIFIFLYITKFMEALLIINRPGVAGAVLRTLPLLIDLFSHSSFVEISSAHLHSQTVRARELKF